MGLNCRQLHDHVLLPLIPIVQDVGLRGLPFHAPTRDALLRQVNNRVADLDMQLFVEGITAPTNNRKLAGALLEKGVPLTKMTPKGTQFKTDLDVLRRINYHYNTSSPTPTFPWLPGLIERRKLEKTRMNLESFQECDDGMLRTALKAAGGGMGGKDDDKGGTRTGRYSSSELDYCPVCHGWSHGTNLQNIPKHDDVTGISLKDCFKPRQGWMFGELDYSLLEIRIQAYCTRDPVLIERIETPGIDLHTIHMRECGFEDRTAAKNFFYAWRGAGGEQAIQIALAKRGIFLEQSVISTYMQRLFAIYSRTPAWIMETDVALQRQATEGEKRVVRNAFGRPRVLLGSNPLKEALATIISSTASGVMDFVLLRLAYETPEVLPYICIQIHDSLGVHAPAAKFPWAMGVVKAAMERPVWMYDRFCTLPAEAKASSEAWSKMKAYEC